MRKSITLGIVGISCLIALLATDRIALGQAGSTGGTLGKTDKSASGGEEVVPPPDTKAEGKVHRPSAKSDGQKSPCRNALGTWAFSNGVSVVIKAGGGVTASDGGLGKWSCDGGMVTIDWGSWTDHYAISSAGNRLSGNGGLLHVSLTAEKR
jgi:hypothetical protein